ncbi:glycerate kinase [Saccharopolyspora hattusasensis]|uniref:glycerate kinase n=1 Tax=Saccharopolyspora hattusasensis TaxID=1128679 RepID=UPI003D986FD7
MTPPTHARDQDLDRIDKKKHQLGHEQAPVGSVLIAPDKFKGSLSAPEVADAIAAGIRKARPELELRLVPVADGGEGTVAAALAAGAQRHRVRVTGPTGQPVDADIAIKGPTAIVELATASGLTLVPHHKLAPLTATSYGTGDLIRAALDAGARTIVLGVGGSACTDGGAGMLAALGARITDASGTQLRPGGAALLNVSRVDLTTLDSRLADTEVVLASDVDNPLLGKHGAACVYAPQKGADPSQVELLDTALARWACAVAKGGDCDMVTAPSAGAAGGVGFAALAALGARRRLGVEVILELTGFLQQLQGARLVITGEGRLDEQTLHGKAPAGVAQHARTAGVPVIAIAGTCTLPAERLRKSGITSAYTLTSIERDVGRSMRNAAVLLEQLGAQLATEQWPPNAWSSEHVRHSRQL